ncbi:MAG: hypothetical protein LM590_04710 [Thermofilum sp.]|nr:hypothetical protein [Thermofilum sp.]
MPVLVVANIIGFKNGSYYANINDVCSLLPHIKEGGSIKFYIIEVRDESGKLINKFKPFRELSLKIDTYLYYNNWYKCICIPVDLASGLNIGVNYRIAVILTAYEGMPLLPFEIRPLTYDARNVLESLSRIQTNLLMLCLKQAALNKAVSYLWDANFRLEEGDIEGARVSVRNSLQVLLDEFIPVIEVREESEKFPEKLKGLINKLKEFVHYGGPHPGPAPKITTEMVISITIELVKYLAKALDTSTISIKPSAQEQAKGQ